MLALVCPPVDSDSSDEDEENYENELTLVKTSWNWLAFSNVGWWCTK